MAYARTFEATGVCHTPYDNLRAPVAPPVAPATTAQVGTLKAED
jgi:hypothetical protein